MNRRLVVIGAATSVVFALGAYALLPDRPGGDRRLVRSPAAVGEQLQPSPATPLTGLTWRDFHGFRLPYSASEGPHAIKGDLSGGFARSPLGALLAAIHISVRSDPRWGLATASDTVNTQFIGPDRIGILASMNLPSATPGTPRAYATLEAFRWQGYTPQTASVDVVSAGPGDSDQVIRAATRVQVQWDSRRRTGRAARRDPHRHGSCLRPADPRAAVHPPAAAQRFARRCLRRPDDPPPRPGYTL